MNDAYDFGSQTVKNVAYDIDCRDAAVNQEEIFRFKKKLSFTVFAEAVENNGTMRIWSKLGHVKTVDYLEHFRRKPVRCAALAAVSAFFR